MFHLCVLECSQQPCEAEATSCQDTGAQRAGIAGPVPEAVRTTGFLLTAFRATLQLTASFQKAQSQCLPSPSQRTHGRSTDAPLCLCTSDLTLERRHRMPQGPHSLSSSSPVPMAGRTCSSRPKHDGYIRSRMAVYLLSETDNFH